MVRLQQEVASWTATLVAAAVVVACGGGPTEGEAAVCREAGQVRDLLAELEGGSASSVSVERTGRRIDALAEVANGTDNTELRANASHLLVQWEARASEPPRAAEVVRAVTGPLEAIVAECDRLGAPTGTLTRHTSGPTGGLRDEMHGCTMWTRPWCWTPTGGEVAVER